MCYKPTQSEQDRAREAPARDQARHHDPTRPWTNSRPRAANPEPDRGDLERGLEKLTALVGR